MFSNLNHGLFFFSIIVVIQAFHIIKKFFCQLNWMR